ncbi:MAG: ATP phosphoribosyltransferase [Phycisphaerae bacterium]
MSEKKLRLVIPTGRLLEPIRELMAEAGLVFRFESKDYRPVLSDSRFEIKLLKAANIPTLVQLGAHDVGFSGLDWVNETSAAVTTILDTGLLPVRIVSAAPRGSRPFSGGSSRPLIVASEYENLTKAYMAGKGVPFQYVRTYGATEVFPPEDADLIVDNVATGRTLTANNLEIVDELLKSSALMFANPTALKDDWKRDLILDFEMLIRSALEARTRVLLEMNVSAEKLEAVVGQLPAMRSPTVQRLHGQEAYAVRAAVQRNMVPTLLRKLHEAGATDILQLSIQRVMP